MDCEQWQKRRLHLAARTTQSQIAMTWLEDLKNSGIKQPKHTKWIFRHNKGSTMATAAKTPLLKWLAFFQTLSRLFQFTENVKCGRVSLELISWELHSSLERERKSSSFLVYVLHKTWNYAFSPRSRPVRTAKKCIKKCGSTWKVVGLLIKPIVFFLPLSFPSPSPSSLLKLPFLGAVPQRKTAYVCPPMQNQAPRNNNFFYQVARFSPSVVTENWE